MMYEQARMFIRKGRAETLEIIIENSGIKFSKIYDLSDERIIRSSALLSHALRDLQTLGLTDREVHDDRTTTYKPTEKGKNVSKAYRDFIDFVDSVIKEAHQIK